MEMRLVVEPVADTPDAEQYLTYKYVPAHLEWDRLMREVSIIGVGAHPTGRFMDKPLKAIAYPAIWDALDDAGVTPADFRRPMSAIRSAGCSPGRKACAARSFWRIPASRAFPSSMSRTPARAR